MKNNMERKIFSVIILCLLVHVNGFSQNILFNETNIFKGDTTFNRHNEKGLKEGFWFEDNEYTFYENGVPSGIYLKFGSNGSISVLGQYSKGEICGKWFYFDDRGYLTRIHKDFSKNTDTIVNRNNYTKYVPRYKCHVTTYYPNSSSIKSKGTLLLDNATTILDSESTIKYGEWDYYEDTIKVEKYSGIEDGCYFLESISIDNEELVGPHIDCIYGVLHDSKNSVLIRREFYNNGMVLCGFYYLCRKYANKEDLDVIEFSFVNYNSLEMAENGFSIDSIERIHTYDCKDIKTDSIGFTYYCYFEKYYYPNGNLEKEGYSWEFDANTANREQIGIPDNVYDRFYDPKTILVGEWKYYDENGELISTKFYDEQEFLESLR